MKNWVIKKNILELLANGTMEAQGEGDEIAYAIGLTEDGGGIKYMNIIPKDIMESALLIRNISLNIIKQKQHNRKYRLKR